MSRVSKKDAWSLDVSAEAKTKNKQNESCED